MVGPVSPSGTGGSNFGSISKEDAFAAFGSAVISKKISGIADAHIDGCADKCAERMKRTEACALYADDTGGCIRKSGKFTVEQSANLGAKIGLGWFFKWIS